MAVRIGVQGFKELDAALGTLSKAAARGALRRILKKAAKPMAERASEMAPRETGGLAGSVTVSTTAPPGYDAGKSAFAEAIKQGASRAAAGKASRAARAAQSASGERAFAEVFVGPDRRPAAIQQEFGNVNHPAQPFMRPAFDTTSSEALAIIRDEIEAEITKSVRRAQARALKRAARG